MQSLILSKCTYGVWSCNWVGGKRSKESFRRSFNSMSAWQPSAKDARRGNLPSKGLQGSRLVPNTQILKEHQMILPEEQENCIDCVPCHFSLQGHLASCGLVQCLGTPMEEDSVLVKVLKRQGAIPFAMTNVPQSLFR